MSEPVHRAGILSNPLSGRNKKSSSSIKHVLETHSTIPQYEVETLKEIDEAVSGLAQQQVTVIVINGGDGTVQAVLTSLLHHQPFKTLPLVAILPSGTSNLNAGDVGLKGNRPAALQQLIEWTHGQGQDPSILQRHILRVQRVPQEDPIYGMVFGAGAIYQGAQVGWKTKQSVGKLGEVGATLIIGRFILSLLSSPNSHITPIQATVRLNDHSSIQTEFLTILTTTLERLFLGLRPYWGTEAAPLHYTAVKRKPKHMLRTLPSLLFGKPHKYGTPEHGYDSHNVRKIELDLHDGFTVDGEDYKPDPRQGPVCITDGGQVSFIQF
ncbi:MAG: diacylglycerol/lipid kinase family protein [Nitrospirales bacterium]